MSNTDNEQVGDILKLIRDVAGQSLENHFWILRQYGELRQRISSGEWDEHWVNEQYAQYTAERGPQFRKQLADLGAAYQRALTDMSREWSEQFYARLEAVGAGHSPDGVAPADSALTLEIRGAIGTEAMGPLTLLNRHTVPVPITFELGDVVGPQGKLPYRIVRIDPEAPVLAPGERREVLVRAALIDGLFEAGQSYRMTFTINGRERTDVILTITVAPSTVAPSTGAPVTRDPVTGDPVTGDPATRDPATRDPATRDPSTDDPSTNDPSTPVTSAAPAETGSPRGTGETTRRTGTGETGAQAQDDGTAE